MRLFVYMLVNVNVIYYVHVCEQARWACSAGNSAIENLCIIIIINFHNGVQERGETSPSTGYNWQSSPAASLANQLSQL